MKALAAEINSALSLAVAGDRQFEVLGDRERYAFRLLDVPITFEFDKPRWVNGDLYGQLTVRTDLIGARTFNGSLGAPGTINLSSPTHRYSRARDLKELGDAPQIDWRRLLEEFASRVLSAEATGQDAINLRDVMESEHDDHHDIEGIYLVRRAPSMIFGDAGTGKSFWALWALGTLATRGLKVMLIDWELDALAHHRRWRAIWGAGGPDILHVRCSRPLLYEAERLRRIGSGVCYRVLPRGTSARHRWTADRPHAQSERRAWPRAAVRVAVLVGAGAVGVLRVSATER